MKVRDIMTANPFVVTPRDSVSDAAEIMRHEGIGCLPVVDNLEKRSLVGVITDRDITLRCVARAHSGSCSIGVHMTTGRLHTAHPGDDVSKVIKEMELAQVRRIPVVIGDDRTLVGIAAQADLARKLGPKDPVTVEQVLERVSEPELVTA